MNKKTLSILSLLVIVGFGFVSIGFKAIGFILMFIGGISFGQLLNKKS